MTVLQSGVSNPAPRDRSLAAFFVLVFALALPFWVIGGLTGVRLSPDLPLGALQFVCPGVAAAILVYRGQGSAGLQALLRHSVDLGRLRGTWWWLPTILLLPAIYVLTYVLTQVMGLPVPTPQFPILAALALFIAFFVAGQGEELGWSGYAIDPMQARWTALRASLLLGAI